MKSKKEKKVPVKMFMMLAENAKCVNTYASLSNSGQQTMLDRFMEADTHEEEKKIIEEMNR